MAVTVTSVSHDVQGDRRIERLTVLSDSETSKIVETQLNHISDAAVACDDTAAKGAGETSVWINSKTASATEDDEGFLFLNPITANATYIVTVGGW